MQRKRTDFVFNALYIYAHVLFSEQAISFPFLAFFFCSLFLSGQKEKRNSCWSNLRVDFMNRPILKWKQDLLSLRLQKLCTIEDSNTLFCLRRRSLYYLRRKFYFVRSEYHYTPSKPKMFLCLM